jgi:hypothetical protein
MTALIAARAGPRRWHDLTDWLADRPHVALRELTSALGGVAGGEVA